MAHLSSHSRRCICLQWFLENRNPKWMGYWLRTLERFCIFSLNLFLMTYKINQKHLRYKILSKKNNFRNAISISTFYRIEKKILHNHAKKSWRIHKIKFKKIGIFRYILNSFLPSVWHDKSSKLRTLVIEQLWKKDVCIKPVLYT